MVRGNGGWELGGGLTCIELGFVLQAVKRVGIYDTQRHVMKGYINPNIWNYTVLAGNPPYHPEQTRKEGTYPTQ